MAEAAKLMAGKRGVVFGVANNRSIAWGITKACHDNGAEIALTFQGDAIKKRVEPLAAESAPSSFFLATSPTSKVSMRCLSHSPTFGGHRFSRPCRCLFRQRGARRALYRHEQGQFHPDAARLLLLLHRARQARRETDAGRRLIADADLLRRREGDAALQCDGRGQGRPRSERAVSRSRSRQGKYPRQRHLRRADQDAGGIGHRRLPLYPQVERVQFAASGAPCRSRMSAAARSISFPTLAVALPARSCISTPATTWSA